MYVNTSTDITQPVINAYKAGFDAKSGGKNHIAGH
jgi:hypothetical protein